jgi:hypothetical protein
MAKCRGFNRAAMVVCGIASAVGVEARVAEASEFRLYGSQTSDAPDSFRYGLVEFSWPVTGQSTRIGSAGVLFDGDFAPDGTLYAPGTGLMRVELTTGAFTQIGSWDIPDLGFIRGLAFGPDGRAYGVDNAGISTSLYEINLSTGRATRIGAVGTAVLSIEFGPDGVLYGGGSGVFTINPQTGARGASVIPGSAGLQTALDFGTDGIWRSIVQVANAPDRLLQLNIGSNSTALIGLTSEQQISGLASIPTPGVGAAVLMGLAAWGRRRRG